MMKKLTQNPGSLMSRAIETRVTAKDKDEHICQGVVTQQVSNFILPNDALSVQIAGTGITNIVNLVSTQAVDVAKRTWTASWTVPTDTAGQTLYFQFGGGVSDKPCAAHGGSDDTDVNLDGYKGQFAVVKVDLDVDANYDGKIDDTDEPLEMNPGGLVCVCTNNLTRIELKVLPTGRSGKVTLAAPEGGGLIRVWTNANRTGQITLPKTWNAGALPGTLWVEGVTNSVTARDVELKLDYAVEQPGASGEGERCKDTVRLTVVKVEIEKPKGSVDANPNPVASWLSAPCYHFDFQGVVAGSPGPYTLAIKGRVEPIPPASYKWTLDTAAGTLSNDTAATPTHTAPANEGQGTITLKAPVGTTDTGYNDNTKINIYRDHLARDQENFGTGISCAGSWSFSAFNTTITMENTWNCHGSSAHHYNGSGNGGATGIDFASTWAVVTNVVVKHVADGGRTTCGSLIFLHLTTRCLISCP